MQLQIAFLVAVCLVHIAVAHDEDGEKHHGHHKHHGPPPSKFPECKEFEDEVHQELKAMHESGDAGPDKCEDEDHHACRYKDLMAAKESSGAVPSEECWKQAEAYYKP